MTGTWAPGPPRAYGGAAARGEGPEWKELVMGPCVTAGTAWFSFTEDSGYMPFGGWMWRSVGSLVGVLRFDELDRE